MLGEVWILKFILSWYFIKYKGVYFYYWFFMNRWLFIVIVKVFFEGFFLDMLLLFVGGNSKVKRIKKFKAWNKFWG